MITVPELKRQYVRRGIIWEPVNLFGVRYSENQKHDDFNDFLGIATNNTIKIYQGTTDPGWKSTTESTKGAAHLCLGYHQGIWAIGIHGKHNPIFAHEAFIQVGGHVTIWRDSDRDGEQDNNEKILKGWFGLNMHRASIHGSDHIGPYSEGCQVHQDPESLNVFLEIAKKSELKFFSYMLFDRTEWQ